MLFRSPLVFETKPPPRVVHLPLIAELWYCYHALGGVEPLSSGSRPPLHKVIYYRSISFEPQLEPVTGFEPVRTLRITVLQTVGFDHSPILALILRKAELFKSPVYTAVPPRGCINLSKTTANLQMCSCEKQCGRRIARLPDSFTRPLRFQGGDQPTPVSSSSFVWKFQTILFIVARSGSDPLCQGWKPCELPLF